jgi:hypothetical protein
VDGDAVSQARAVADAWGRLSAALTDPEPGAEWALWFDRDGHPIGPVGWDLRMRDDAYRCVGEHWVRGWRISTVWTGIDQSFAGQQARREPGRRPLIYETMIFGPSGLRELGPGDFEFASTPAGDVLEEILGLLSGMNRAGVYATADEAGEGHERAVHAVRVLLGARPWQVQTWEQATGQQWAVTAGGWRLVIRDGAMAGLVPAGDPGPSFTCPACGTVSHHPENLARGYCARCHAFTGPRLATN